MHRTAAPSARLAPPGLLPWQYGVLGWAAGILALQFPWAAFFSFILLLIFSRVGGLGPWGQAGLAACVLLGWGAAWMALPTPPPETPQWMRQRTPVTLTGRVEGVTSRPGRMLRVMLAEVRYRLDSGEQGELPGRVLWNWEAPATRPHAGQRVRVRLRVKPVHGFRNPGGWDTAFHWRRQGVFFRGWSHGLCGDPALSGPPPGRLEGWREGMRRAVSGPQPDGRPAMQEEGGVPDVWRGRALLAALVLGDRLNLDQDLYTAVQDASLGHSLALSGLHLGFAAALGFGLAWMVGRVRPRVYLRCPQMKLGVLLAVPCACFYLWLGGASPSLVRAAVMLASWGVMLWLDRERPLLDGLFLAVLLILAASPLSLYDIRLQFSALAVAGIAVAGPLIWRGLARVRLPGERNFRAGETHELRAGWDRGGNDAESRGGVPGDGEPNGMKLGCRLADARTAWASFRGRSGTFLQRSLGRVLRGALGTLGVSLAATLALLPLSAWTFGQVALSLWTNMLWLPLLGLFAVPAGLGGAVLATVPGLEGAGQWLLALDAQVLDRGARALMTLRESGLAPVLTPMRPLWPQLLGTYALVAALVVFWRTRSRALWPVAALALGLLLWPPVERALDGTDREVRLSLLDVGQGQAVLIEAPGGARTLIDGGGTWSRDFDIGRAVVTPALTWGRLPSLARVVLTHPDIDHYRGLFHPLSRCTVGGFAHNGRWPEGGEGEELQAVLAGREIPVAVWRAGERHELAAGLELEVLHPASPEAYADNNNGSLVLRLVWLGRGLALIPGDVEIEGQRTLLERGGDLSAEVLVLPHHGGRDALVPALYAACAPRLAVASAGFMNYLGFPHREVRAALADRGIPLMATPRCGSIRLVWDTPQGPPRIETLSGTAPVELPAMQNVRAEDRPVLSSR